MTEKDMALSAKHATAYAHAAVTTWVVPSTFVGEYWYAWAPEYAAVLVVGCEVPHV